MVVVSIVPEAVTVVVIFTAGSVKVVRIVLMLVETTVSVISWVCVGPGTV